MKKVFQKSFIALCVLVTTVIATSCSNAFDTGLTDTEVIPEYQKESIANFGKANRIFSSPNAARFYTGQNVQKNFHMKNNLIFQANLVEYDSIDPKIIKYIDTIQSTKNAWMHQRYGDIDYIDGKTYVEFATYYDADNEQIFKHEIRIFDGGFWKEFDRNKWYAKSIDFSPDFKIDISHNINIETGEKETYTYDKAVYINNNFNSDNFECVEVSTPDQKLNKLGTINKIYKNKLKKGLEGTFDPLVINNSFEEYLKYDSYLIEFASANEKLLDYADKTHLASSCFEPYNVKYDNTKTYAEYIVYTGYNSNKVHYIELLVRNSEGNYSKLIFAPDIFNIFLNYLSSNMTIDQFSPFKSTLIDKMETLGTLKTYYDPKTFSPYFYQDEKVYKDSHLFEYTSLSEKALKQYDELVAYDKENDYWWLMQRGDYTTYDDSCRYVEVIVTMDRKTNKVINYQFRFKEPTGYDAHGTNMTLEQFDAFFAN